MREPARRIELAEAVNCLEITRTIQRLRPEAGATWREIAGGWALYGGAGSPVNKVLAAGLDAAVTPSHLDRIEEFYLTRACPVEFALCPLAHPSLMALLAVRGYRLTQLETTMTRRIAAHERWPGPDDGARVRIAEDSEKSLVARVIFRAFGEGKKLSEDDLALASMSFRMPVEAAFLAEVDGRPAAGAAMAIRDGVALFYGDAVLPEYRGRRFQSALLRARLLYCVEHGVDVVAASTLPGSTSESNYERAGFRVLYTRPTMIRA